MNETIISTDDHERNYPAKQGATSSGPQTVCPECDGRVCYDEEHGEQTCKECGLVLNDNEIDRGPEWRAFFADEADERSRVGAPVTELMHDKGLSTTISWQDKDAHGNSISSEKRAQLQRLRTWDERFRTKNAQERNLRQAFGEIERMASALGLPKPCRETACVLYRRAVDEELLPGRSIESMATASLYATARQHSTPRTLDAFESVSRVERLRVQRAYRYLSRELGLNMGPTDPTQYLRQYASKLDVSDEAERLANEVLETAKSQGVHSGRSPAGLAAAAIYAATRLVNDGLTQEVVSDTASVSEVTIRNRYQELLDVYGEHGDH